MRKIFLLVLLFSLVCCWCGSVTAQVRVGRSKGVVRERKPRAIKKHKKEVPQKAKDDAKIIVTKNVTSGQRAAMDGHFLVQWGAKQKLAYDDFLCNKNLYNKFLPARDSDLTQVIYPDYRVFYSKLNERLVAEGGMDDDFWQERVERLLKERSDSENGNIMSLPWIDTGFVFAISIDSPAASAINISPQIYAVNETTYYYNITAVFSKYDSWMIVKSKDILEHEQIHFDIFEVYARKMRKHLLETLKKSHREGTISDIAKDITPEYEQLYQQINDVQLEFDRQTAAVTSANAPLLKTNAKWTQFLKEQLEALKEYSVAEGTITLK